MVARSFWTYLWLLIGIFQSFKTEAKVRLLGFDPFNQILIVRNFYPDSVDLSKFFIAYGDSLHSLAQLKIETGNVYTPGKTNVIFSGINIKPDSGFIALIDFRYVKDINHPQALADFVQWGNAGNPWEYKADSLGFWTAGETLQTLPPYQYLGNSVNRGKSFWQSFKAPQLAVRLVKLNTQNNSFVIKNTGTTNVNIQKLRYCFDNQCYDSLFQIPGVSHFGNIDIPKGDSLRIYVPSLNSATDGSISLFLPINRMDSLSMVDYLRWGNANDRFGLIATQKKIWDTTVILNISSNDSLKYVGNFSSSQNGPMFWHIDSVSNSNAIWTPIDPDWEVIITYKAIFISNKGSGKFDIQCFNNNEQLLKSFELGPYGDIILDKESLKGVLIFKDQNGQFIKVINL